MKINYIKQNKVIIKKEKELYFLSCCNLFILFVSVSSKMLKLFEKWKPFTKYLNKKYDQ